MRIEKIARFFVNQEINLRGFTSLRNEVNKGGSIRDACGTPEVAISANRLIDSEDERH